MKYWTSEERRTAFDLHRNGLTYAEIADKLPGRTVGSVRSIMAGRGKSREQIVAERKEREERATEDNNLKGCNALRDATIRAIDRYALYRNIHINDAAAFLLSGVRA